MSQFIEKLNQVSQAVPQSIGFRVTQPVPGKPRILLIASLVEANIKDAAERLRGADAGLIRIPEPDSEAKAVEIVSPTVAGLPWGVWLKGAGGDETGPMIVAGSDFIVFPPAISLAVLKDDKVGRILEVETSLSEGLLKTVSELPIDAVLIASKPERSPSLSWYQLMLAHQCASLFNKPLLVTVPATVGTKELQVLWGAGVSGVVVETEDLLPGKLEGLHQIINNLDLPSRHQPRKAEPLLPDISQRTIAPEEEDE